MSNLYFALLAETMEKACSKNGLLLRNRTGQVSLQRASFCMIRLECRLEDKHSAKPAVNAEEHPSSIMIEPRGDLLQSANS
ncbi:MAG: hypothetical protein M3O00_18835 [Pseudomonadota bacterium]|nr:hypothetical protein [Pseudomonadota bacterium]